jgi:diguanylate cyclase (GGDEF)-like protein/PAS domain S-box-containing protein
MRNKYFPGIFGHFFLRAMVIQCVSGLTLLVVVLPFVNYISARMASEQGRTFANATLAATIDALYKDDYGTVVDYCMGIMNNSPNILFIEFSKTNAQRLIITPKKWSLQEKVPAEKNAVTVDPVAEKSTTKPHSLFNPDTAFEPNKSFEFSRAIVVDEKYWGILRVAFAKDAYLASVESFSYTVTGVIVVSCLLSFFLFFASSRRIRKQLSEFEEVAKNLAKGQLSVRAPESAIGEIGLLGVAINRMSTGMKEKSAQVFQLAKIVEQTKDAFILFDLSRNVIFANGALREIAGYPPSHFIGMSIASFANTFGLNLQDLTREIDALLTNHQPSPGHDVVIEGKDKSKIYLEMHLEPIHNDHGEIQNLLLVLSNISERKAAEDEVKTLAFYDQLTSLPNRRLLLDRLNQAMAYSTRSGRQGALLFLDLDNFKSLNDTLGHNIGDLLLQQVAQRLISSVREGDTVARLGGDEFVVMLEDLSEQSLEAATQSEVIGNKILATLNQKYQLGPHEYHNTPSIGITLFNGHDTEMEELIKQADIAMYQAKKAGRNTLRFFNPQMQHAIASRDLLERGLRIAIEGKQFQLHYQVQVDSLLRPLGAEALIRWMHPVRGLLSPNDFIPLAEETGLILPIGAWVLETACAQLKVWQQDAVTSDLQISVNVSARQFRQKEFVAQLQEVVRRHAINPSRLKIELTESVLLENIEDTIATMNALNNFGIQFSLDDFGTGYSSLQYLKRLPLYQLKIDGSFIREITVASSDQTIVRTIIAMAHNLNLSVIAEGVETEEQRQLLLYDGCTNFQGYLFSKPLPLEEFEALLELGAKPQNL